MFSVWLTTIKLIIREYIMHAFSVMLHNLDWKIFVRAKWTILLNLL